MKFLRSTTPISCNYKKLSLYKPIKINLFLIKKSFTYLINKSYLMLSLLHFFWKLEQFCLLDFRNVKNLKFAFEKSKYCNANIFWLIQVAVTYYTLAKRSSVSESSFVLTQANYRKLQRTVKRNWNKRKFLISKLQILIHFVLSLLVSHENKMLVLEINNMKQKLRFFFMLKNIFFDLK